MKSLHDYIDNGCNPDEIEHLFTAVFNYDLTQLGAKDKEELAEMLNLLLINFIGDTSTTDRIMKICHALNPKKF